MIQAASSELLASPLQALPVLFGAGLVTSLNPCIYPMIPITIGILGGAGAGTGAETRSRGKIIGYTLLYALGLALVYATLGLIAGLSGNIFGSISSNRWANLFMANLLLLAGLAMLDVFPVALPKRIVAWASRFGSRSAGSVFLMGATSGLVAAPCGAPAFAAVLTYVGQTRSAGLGFLYLLVFSLGMTALLIGVGLFAGTLAALPKPGRWMEWVKKGAGVVILGMAEYYLIKAGQVW